MPYLLLPARWRRQPRGAFVLRKEVADLAEHSLAWCGGDYALANSRPTKGKYWHSGTSARPELTQGPDGRCVRHDATNSGNSGGIEWDEGTNMPLANDQPITVLTILRLTGAATGTYEGLVGRGGYLGNWALFKGNGGSAIFRWYRGNTGVNTGSIFAREELQTYGVAHQGGTSSPLIGVRNEEWFSTTSSATGGGTYTIQSGVMGGGSYAPRYEMYMLTVLTGAMFTEGMFREYQRAPYGFLFEPTIHRIYFTAAAGGTSLALPKRSKAQQHMLIR